MVDQSKNSSWDSSDFRFHQTEWKKLLDPTRRQAIASELYERYRNPLYTYLRREEAKDLVHQFFMEKIFTQNLIEKADPARGKFRTFLLTALSNYVIDIYRKKKVVIPWIENKESEGSGEEPETIFQRAWADQVLENALKELEQECLRNQKSECWKLFQAWFLDTAIGKGQTRMRDLCIQFQIASREKGFRIIDYTKKRFRSILRRHLYLEGNTERTIDQEIKDFIVLFSDSPRKK